MATILMKPGETRLQYLRKARRYARYRYGIHRHGEHAHCHYSFAVRAALEDTERRFTDTGTFGVEGDCAANGDDHITIDYLNSGDTYALTICFWHGRFIVSSWGDLVEFAERTHDNGE